MRAIVVFNIILFFTYFSGETSANTIVNKHIKKTVTDKVLVVAVIDTGINLRLDGTNMLCKYGHKDFTGTSIIDNHGHGTHISGLIDQYAKGVVFSPADNPYDLIIKMNKLKLTKVKYCQVILKYYDPTVKDNNNLDGLRKALQHAINLKVDVINYSGGGTSFDAVESFLIKKALNLGIKIVVSAGNDGKEIGSRIDTLGFKYEYYILGFKHKYYFYPAAVDSRLTVVGNYDLTSHRAPSSNYGTIVDKWEIGTNVLSYSNSFITFIPVKMSGTSQATAISTGKLVNFILHH
jgi:major intracellular serine protease